MQLLSPTKDERKEKIKQFTEDCLRANFKELGPYVFELKGSFSQTLTLCTLVHGNEIGGIEIFHKLVEEIASKQLQIKSNIRLILGNVEAYFEDKRFLESDLNRSFKIESGHKNPEELRALALEKFLEDTDVLIDIHQTIGPTSTAFFIFEFEQNSYNLARTLKKELPVVISASKRAFRGVTTTAFVISKKKRPSRLRQGKSPSTKLKFPWEFRWPAKQLRWISPKNLPPSRLKMPMSLNRRFSIPMGVLSS